MITTSLNHILQKDIAQAGGKAAALGELTNLGIAVPAGFVVTVEAFSLFLKENRLEKSIITQLQTLNSKNVEQTSQNLQKLIKEGSLSPAVIAAVDDMFDQLKAEFVAVRSSAQ